MTVCDWSTSPSWANYFVELEGNRCFWSKDAYTSLSVLPEEALAELPTPEHYPDFWKFKVVQCIPRPEWKTLIHFREGGKLTTYEAEGKLAHGTVKRTLISDLGVDKNKSFMLEYVLL